LLTRNDSWCIAESTFLATIYLRPQIMNDRSMAVLFPDAVRAWKLTTPVLSERAQAGAVNRNATGVASENGIYGHSRFCNTDFDDKLACLNLSGV
jgi:hypothetical protein